MELPKTIPLPDRYCTIDQVLDGKFPENSKTNVIGIVEDFLAPIATKGADWKCEISLYDQSVQWDCERNIQLSAFRPQKEMPHNVGCGDVVVIHQAKIQTYRSNLSLCVNFETSLHIYKASQIPKPPALATAALQPACWRNPRAPTHDEEAFVSAFYHSVDRSRIPAPSDFEKKKVHSIVRREKYSELKGVADMRFHDLVVEFVEDPYEQGDRMTLWVSDYTENAGFPDHNPDDSKEETSGHRSNSKNKTKKAQAPVKHTKPRGRLSMQITCYPPHTNVIRDYELRRGTWARLSNVQIKFGRNAQNVEGFLREDRAHPGRTNVQEIVMSDDAEDIDERAKEALRRKREYLKANQQQLKGIHAAMVAGAKRVAELGPKETKSLPSTKARRKASRQKQQEAAAKKVEKLPDGPFPAENLNSQVKCERQDSVLTAVNDMLEPVSLNAKTDDNKSMIQLPFININYRTDVRVVDFMPRNLLDFSHQVKKRKRSEFAVLSDNELSEAESDSNEHMTDDHQDRRQGTWEWRFFLLLEDASTHSGKKKSAWVFVDNPAAQYLTGLDASDLEEDSSNLASLRERLFVLWGNLEESKTKKSAEALARSRTGDAPRSDSDEEMEGTEKVTNRPFSACIRQYGIKIKEADQRKSDAGDGKRWQRIYGMFGTKIKVA